jgi:hypothetical protein
MEKGDRTLETEERSLETGNRKSEDVEWKLKHPNYSVQLGQPSVAGCRLLAASSQPRVASCQSLPLPLLLIEPTGKNCKNLIGR